MPDTDPCPECRQLKCQNCTQVVFDSNDEWATCPCRSAGHPHRPELVR